MKIQYQLEEVYRLKEDLLDLGESNKVCIMTSSFGVALLANTLSPLYNHMEIEGIIKKTRETFENEFKDDYKVELCGRLTGALVYAVPHCKDTFNIIELEDK